MSISSADIINLNDYTGTAADGYKNSSLTHTNDHVVRLSVMTEDFYWHYHPNSDETFIVIEGTLLLDLDDDTIELNKGQMITVPQNIPHRIRPKGGQSINLTIELAAMVTLGVEKD